MLVKLTIRKPLFYLLVFIIFIELIVIHFFLTVYVWYDGLPLQDYKILKKSCKLISLKYAGIKRAALVCENHYQYFQYDIPKLTMHSWQYQQPC